MDEFEVYKTLRAKFGFIKNDEEVYFIVRSGYLSRLIEDPDVKLSKLRSNVIELFTDNNLTPLFIWDDCAGGIYSINENNTDCLGYLRDECEKKLDPDLLALVLDDEHDYGGTICFKRKSISPLLCVMRSLAYCNILSSDGILLLKHSKNGTPIVIEDFNTDEWAND